MNRISYLFSRKTRKILSVYFTAGYPLLEDTPKIIKILEKYKVDIIEIGIPFSDPVADGPIIQKSNSIALLNGMSLKLLFKQLENIRKIVSIPILLMGYINPVLRMGMESFLLNCSRTGIDGVIIPDLPPEEYLRHYRELFNKYRISCIFLITPQTPDERIRFIDEISEGFIYMVSSSSTTGIKDEFDKSQLEYFNRVIKMNLKNYCLAGFGISNKNTFDIACRYVNGAIMGSAFIKALDGMEDLEDKINKFINSLY